MPCGSDSTQFCTGNPRITNSTQACGPNSAALAAAKASAVTLAAPNTRQRAEAISMTGNSTPSCGLRVNSPISIPASRRWSY